MRSRSRASRSHAAKWITVREWRKSSRGVVRCCLDIRRQRRLGWISAEPATRWLKELVKRTQCDGAQPPSSSRHEPSGSESELVERARCREKKAGAARVDIRLVRTGAMAIRAPTALVSRQEWYEQKGEGAAVRARGRAL